MGWTALIGNVAKGAAKGAAKRVVSGARKVRKKGKKMAENIMGSKKEKDTSSSIVVREKTTTLAPFLGGDGGEGSDSSIKKPSSNASPLDRIDSSLLDIMSTLKDRRKLMLKKSRMARVQTDKEKKGKREGILERMKGMGKKMVGSVVAGAKGWWERLQKFLLMTLLGSLVVSIKENWEAIKKKIEEVVKFIQDLWNFMSPVLIPLFEGFKWVVKMKLKMWGAVIRMIKDKPQVEKETDQLSQNLKEVEKKSEWLTAQFKEAKDGTDDLGKKSFKDLANEAGVGDEVSPDNKEKSEKNLEDVAEEAVQQIGESDIETKLDDFKIKLEEVKDSSVKVDTTKMKKYDVGAFPVPETTQAIVHKGEVIIPAHKVKMVGGAMKINNIINLMQAPSKLEGLAREFAPMRDQIPSIVNQVISQSQLGDTSREVVERMKNTISIINEQASYEDPSSSVVLIPLPSPSQPSGGGEGGETVVISAKESAKQSLNRYVNAVIQQALY